MTPVYFPFTYVSKQVADVLSACFDKTIVYQPSLQIIPESMKQLADKGLLEIRIPADSDEEKLAGIIQEYKNWAQVHQGGKMSFFKTQTDNIPFYDEISAHQIRSDIKKKQKNETSEQKTDPILQARIFLSIAQEFDENHWDVSSGLESFAEMEKSLIEQIRGGNESDNIDGLTPNQAITKDEPGSHMTDQRIKSWARLLACDPEKSNFYLTTSRDVIEFLMEDSQDMKMVFRETLPENPDSNEWKKNLKDNIENINKDSIAGKGLKPFPAEDAANVLTVYRVPFRADEFFSRYSNRELSQKTDKILENKKEYTLIGIIEMA